MRKRLLIALPLVLLLAAGFSAAANAAVANPGFEQDGAATGEPSGWQSTGKRAADFTEAGGHSGRFHLSHSSAGPFKAETTQRVSGLQPGWHTLRAWVRRSAGDNDSWIALEGWRPGRARVRAGLVELAADRRLGERDRAVLRDRAPHHGPRAASGRTSTTSSSCPARRGCRSSAPTSRASRSPRTRAASTGPSTAGRATRSRFWPTAA